MTNLTSSLPGAFDQLLTEASIDAIIAIDIQLYITTWNNAAEVMLGKTREEVLGRAFFEIIGTGIPDGELQKAIEIGLLGVKSFLPSTSHFPHRDHLEGHIIPLRDNFRIIGVMYLIHDVAHRLKTENQLSFLNRELTNSLRQLSAANHELSVLTRIASENIREPIRHLYTSIEILIQTEAAKLSNSGRANLRRIQSSLTRTDLLLNDIITVTQISGIEKPEAEIQLQEVLHTVMEALEEKITAKNAIVTTGELCPIRTHRNQIYLLLYHLIDNAIKFNESPQPVVHIVCKEVNITENEKQSIPAGIYRKLSVVDTGIGFNEDEQQKIFELFEKLHDKEYKGTGTGLAIVRKIVDAHLGFVHVESTPRLGSSFEIYFPV